MINQMYYLSVLHKDRHQCYEHPKTEADQIYLIFLQCCDLHEIQQSILQEACLTSNHGFKTCGGPEALTSTTSFLKCGVESSLLGQER